VLANLNIAKRALPQDGAFSVLAGRDKVFIRVSIMPTVSGEKAVLRFTGGRGVLPLLELGLHPLTLFSIQTVCRKLGGAILFCGPTGSGKTTTMYSVLDSLSENNINLVSIEDPVETVLMGVSQTAINEQEGLTYASCLKAIVRQDPDVILLGEIRDSESAQMALRATLTGHLLLSSIHARNVFDVLLRLRNLGIDDLTMAQGVALIICQRLIPSLCDSCKVIDLKNSNIAKRELFQPVGCKQCDYSGFAGRVLADESLLITKELSDCIASGEISTARLREFADNKSYVSLDSSVRTLLKEGIICMDGFERVVSC